MKLISLIFAIVCLAGCFGAEPQKTGKEGKLLPDFSLLSKDSISLIHMRDILIGKPVALFFFSPYCNFCKAQTEDIIEDIDELKDIQFYFVTSSSFPLAALKSFVSEYKLAQYPNITVGIDTAHAISNYFEITAVPYIAVYSKQKTLNKTFRGKTYSSQLKKAAEQ